MRNVLRSIGPNIESCGTPDKMFWTKILFDLLSTNLGNFPCQKPVNKHGV